VYGKAALVLNAQFSLGLLTEDGNDRLICCLSFQRTSLGQTAAMIKHVMTKQYFNSMLHAIPQALLQF
jgi:hypothetical protein